MLPKSAAFTLVEVLLVLIVLSVLATASIFFTGNSLDETRYNATQKKIEEIRNAIIGNPNLKDSSKRRDFGFLGDIGAIPTNGQGIASLITNPGLPAFAIDTGSRIGVGWRGPYLTSQNTSEDFTKDAWGNSLVYDATASPPFIKSLGSDGAAGGTSYAADLLIEFPAELRTSSVQGFLANYDGTQYERAAEVIISYPNGSGVITTATDTLISGDKGYFQIANIPFGIRSLSIYRGSSGSSTQTLEDIFVTVDQETVSLDSSQSIFSNIFSLHSLSFTSSGENSALEGGYISLGDKSLRTGAFSFWIKTSAAVGRTDSIISKMAAGDYNGEANVFLNAGKISFQLNYCSAGVPPACVMTAKQVDSNATLNDNTWHHIVVAMSPDTSDGDGKNMYMWVDGTKQTDTDLTNYGIEVSGQPEVLEVGRNSETGISFYQGLIDDLTVFNAVPTNSNVTELYNSGKPAYNYNLSFVASLKHWLRLSEGMSGTNVPDVVASGGAWTGTLGKSASGAYPVLSTTTPP